MSLNVHRIRSPAFQLHHALKKHYSVAAATKGTAKASELFSDEQRRQRENVGRIEKIEVRYLGLPHDTTLVMNRELSTPYDCARHIGEKYCQQSALALLDNKTPWDMRRPLRDSCTLQLLNFTAPEPHIANKAFWRSCSFLLGAVLQASFKPEAGLFLHSFPKPNGEYRQQPHLCHRLRSLTSLFPLLFTVKSGSFVHDIVLVEEHWNPTVSELRALSIAMVKLAQKNLPIERLDVSSELALEMFHDNPYKREQIPSVAGQNNGQVTVYRVGEHVDISKGPMMGSSGLLGRCTISVAHPVKEGSESGKHFYRMQGVALPAVLRIGHFAYNILENRSRKLNPAKLPNEPFEDTVAEQVA
ncbi:39S ribosomal protein L39, mitochondrial isoform X1 [Anopheles stephensi]|uniref:39S ribosomal protein L39, mitochondrial isoform X1 n=1 Tax=Anopheles stephensi TaxID=30069 RepID=UPI0016589DDE|nr:39S ribosomal protein L39, mitochondrial isoform X1 [Anopheles stephensi]